MATLKSLPLELIWMITDYLDSATRLSLSMASKSFLFKVPALRLADDQDSWIFHDAFERTTPARRPVLSLLCHECHKLKPRCNFSDSQGKRKREWRFCIRCGIRDEKYLGRQYTFRVGGIRMFGCARCVKAFPETEEAEYGWAGQYNWKGRWCKRCWTPTVAYTNCRNARLLSKVTVPL